MKIEVINLVELEDGGATIDVSIDQEYKDHFKKLHGLKRFSHKKFQEFIITALEKKLDSLEKNK